MNKFIKYIWQLINSTSNATLEVPLLRPCQAMGFDYYVFFKLEKAIIIDLFILYLLFPEFLKINKKHFRVLNLKKKITS